LITLVFGLFVLSACSQKGTNKNANANPANSTDANVKTGVKPVPDSQVVVMETADYGRIVIELYPNIAPQMVERFKKLISEHFYDGTAIHRINPDSGIIQGGDPNTKDPNVAMWGRGDSPYPDISAEFSDVVYERGTVGAARQGPPPGSAIPDEQFFNTANCQFFITLKKQPAFDQKYTVFGRVVDGIKNAEIIMNAPTVEGTERPSDKIVITSVTLQPRGNYPTQ
jgi:cyclophilin family peptidyl-prolyl cis-trans isomerase